ncbi:hypothetical protein [Streptococcus moroccensis]|uniref:Tryptophan-rich sensory protein n=1 Tax=Streptococcus moroccensis TaxID=1451356 RepID=A0ABT9YR16_9STRE|nr:hypothetical protein [Streptococcus moroccensis]MDQ0222210.1 hypothetical protein [Streptococcus moroccensis]
MIKKSHYASIGLFLLSILLNALSSQGKLLPYTQAQISDRYNNVLAPDYFTFSIWGVIYLLFAVSLAYPFIKRKHPLKDIQQAIAPYNVMWILANIAWIICWSNNWLFLSLLVISFYLVVLVLINTKINAFTNSPALWLMRLTHGLHAGWLIAAWFANAMAFLVKLGVPGQGFIGVTLAIVMAIAIVGLAYLVQGQTQNPLTLLALIWAFAGIASKNAPSSLYTGASSVILVLSWLCIGLLIFFFLKAFASRTRRTY